jgi:uncharacterized protein (DUF1330 family)
MIQSNKMPESRGLARYSELLSGGNFRLKGSDGRLLAADAAPELIEGDWTGEKVILLSFPDRDAFKQWAESAAYREIARDRRAGSEGHILLVQGV